MRSMTSSIRVELGPVQETLLIPLLARARETKRPRGLLRDPRALTGSTSAASASKPASAIGSDVGNGPRRPP